MPPIVAPLPLHPIVTSPVDVLPAGSCEVCAHPLTDHDSIAQRYCSATLANALTRGCICATH